MRRLGSIFLFEMYIRVPAVLYNCIINAIHTRLVIAARNNNRPPVNYPDFCWCQCAGLVINRNAVAASRFGLKPATVGARLLVDNFVKVGKFDGACA